MRLVIVVTAAMLAAGTLDVPRAAQSRRPSKDQLVKAAAAYVAAYQRDFAYLIADERTVQEAFGVRDTVRVPLAARTTVGEMFTTFLAERRHWTTVRDVREVDGVAVPRHEDLPTLLRREAPDALARRLFALNARYNIGGVIRNFNDPMLALLALSDAHRSRFSFEITGGQAGRAAAPFLVLSFRERERPTLIRPESGGAVYARGRLTIDPSTGAVHRTTLTAEVNDIEAELTTDFAEEPRLNMLVPSTFTEHYTARVNGFDDLVTAVSTYSNYRRFEAEGRILSVSP
jgi:hypothetical protein